MKIELGNGVNTIGVGAFENCNSLNSVDIPSLVTIIDTELFRGCTNIKKSLGAMMLSKLIHVLLWIAVP